MRPIYSVILLVVGIALGTVASPIILPLFNNVAGTNIATRVPEMKVNFPPAVPFAPSDVYIWKSIIPPHHEKDSDLPLHRHNYSRVLIPLTNGTLTRKGADGSTTSYVLEKGKPLFLPEDSPAGFHTDENMGNTTIEMDVIQFNYIGKLSAEKLTDAQLKSATVKPGQ